MIIRTSHNARIKVTGRSGRLSTIKKIAKASLDSLNEHFNVMLARPRGLNIIVRYQNYIVSKWSAFSMIGRC